MTRFHGSVGGLILAFALSAGSAGAQDKVRVVDSQAQIFAHFALYQAIAEGYFAAEKLDVSVIVGRGGADSLQAVVTGSQDILFPAGILSVIGAYAKGAPITIIGNGVYGANDVFWYVKSASPIKTLKDLDGKSMAFSAQGSLTHLVAQTLVKELGIAPKLVAVGGIAASRTQMMSGQVESAWSAAPAGLELIRSGEIRVIGSGADSPTFRAMTTRGIVANSNWLAKNRDVAARFMRAIWKGHQYNFSGEKALERYAAHWKFDKEDVKRVSDFYTLDDVRLAPFRDLDGVLALAKQYDFIKEPIPPDSLRKMIDIVYDPSKN